MTDLELLHRYAQRGQREDIEEIVRRFHSLVYGVCRRHLKHPQQAEDATQEVFLMLVKQSRRIRSHVGGWLYRCAYHTAVNTVRKQKLRRKGERQYAELLYALPRERDKHELIRLVDECLTQMPAAERDLIVANILEQTSQRELAAERGVSQQAIGKQLAKSFDRLRGLLRRRGVPIAIGALIAQLRATMTASAATGSTATITAALHHASLAAGTTLLPAVSAKLAVAVVVAATMVTLAPQPSREVRTTQAIEQSGTSTAANWRTRSVTADASDRTSRPATETFVTSASRFGLRPRRPAGAPYSFAGRRTPGPRSHELPVPPTGEAGLARDGASDPAPGASSLVVSTPNLERAAARNPASVNVPVARSASSAGGGRSAAAEPEESTSFDRVLTVVPLAGDFRQNNTVEQPASTETANRSEVPRKRVSERSLGNARPASVDPPASVAATSPGATPADYLRGETATEAPRSSATHGSAPQTGAHASAPVAATAATPAVVSQNRDLAALPDRADVRPSGVQIHGAGLLLAENTSHGPENAVSNQGAMIVAVAANVAVESTTRHPTNEASAAPTAQTVPQSEIGNARSAQSSSVSVVASTTAADGARNDSGGIGLPAQSRVAQSVNAPIATSEQDMRESLGSELPTISRAHGPLKSHRVEDVEIARATDLPSVDHDRQPTPTAASRPRDATDGRSSEANGSSDTTATNQRRPVAADVTESGGHDFDVSNRLTPASHGHFSITSPTMAAEHEPGFPAAVAALEDSSAPPRFGELLAHESADRYLPQSVVLQHDAGTTDLAAMHLTDRHVLADAGTAPLRRGDEIGFASDEGRFVAGASATPVPIGEPCTAILLGMAALGFACRRRRHAV